MFNISDFFKKFSNLEKDNFYKTQKILQTIKYFTNIELTKDNIEIVGERLRIKSTPVYRNEIFMNKSKIEERLRESKIFLTII